MKNILKKILKYLSLFFIIFFVLFYIFFSIFIFNPLEGNYSENIFSLVSIGSDMALYVPEPLSLYKKGTDLVSWNELESTKQWKEFTATELYQEFIKRIGHKEILSQRKKIMHEYNTDPYRVLEELAGQEMALSVRVSKEKNTLDFLVFTRVSFKAKFLYSILSFLARNFSEKAGIIEEKEIITLKLSSTNFLYARRYLDILMIANSRDWLEQIEEVQKNKIPGLLQKSSILQEKIKEKQSQIFFYADGPGFLTFAQKNLRIRNKKLEEELKGIRSFIVQVNADKGRLDFAFYSLLEGVQAKIWKEYFPETKEDIASLLPINTFLHGSFYIPWGNLVKNWQEYVPLKERKTVLDYEQILNQYYKTKDFIATTLGNHLEQETIVCVSNTDFMKENLHPLDFYPAVSLLIRVKDSEKLLSTLEQSLEKIIEETYGKSFKDQKIEFLTRQTYAGQNYYRIKFPDVSGGAIHPAIGNLGPYLVITSHASFLKSLFDVRDQIEKSVKNNSAYQNFEFQAKNTIHFFLDTQGLIMRVKELKKQMIQEILWKMDRNPIKNDQRIENWFEEVLQAVSLWESNVSLSISLENESIKGKVSLFLKPRGNK